MVPGRDHTGIEARWCFRSTSKNSSVQMSSRNAAKATRKKAEAKDSLRRPKLLSELTGWHQKDPNVPLKSEIS